MSDTAIITITDNAAKKIKEFSEGAPEGSGLRLGITGGGCAGLEYQMGIEDQPEEGSKIKTYESNGVHIFIDPKSALYLAGSIIDYVDGLMQSGFHVENPNSRRTCGCNKSFSV